jgi:hypothetical protein
LLLTSELVGKQKLVWFTVNSCGYNKESIFILDIAYSLQSMVVGIVGTTAVFAVVSKLKFWSESRLILTKIFFIFNSSFALTSGE